MPIPALNTVPSALKTTLLVSFTPVVTYYLPAMFGASLPDLAVRSMGITLRTGHSCNYTSTQLGVRVWFHNIGGVGAGPFVVEVNAAQQPVPSGLSAGAAETLWFPGYVRFADNVAIVDATFQVQESDEHNNRRAEWLPVPTLPPTCTPPPPRASDQE
jgi:hypothetical protein